MRPIVLAVLLIAAGACAQQSVVLTLPPLALSGISFTASLSLPPYNNSEFWPANVSARVVSGGNVMAVATLQTVLANGTRVLAFTLPKLTIHGLGRSRLDLFLDDVLVASESVRAIPGWVSVLPPLLTVVVAIGLRQVIIALFAGAWLASFLLNDLNPGAALLRVVDTYMVAAFTAASHPQIILFTMFLGGCIGVTARMGGTAGLAAVVTKVTSSPLSAKIATLAMGLAIFFDDYSSILITGNTMRPIVQALRISPAKFALLIHATGASIASFAPVSSWVGVEIGYIGTQYHQLGLSGDSYVVFLQTIPYRFFPLLMIAFLWIITLAGRDFGPMLAAERAAAAAGAGALPISVEHERMPLIPTPLFEMDFGSLDAKPKESGPLDPVVGKPHRWFNAALPFSVIILATCAGLYIDGRETLGGMSNPPRATLVNIVSNANSVNALLWASLFGSLTAGLLALVQRLLSLSDMMSSWVAGIKEILEAIIILLLAWTLGLVIYGIGTAAFLAQICDGVPIGVLPLLVTITACVMSYATGTAFGTMGILFPLVVPLAASLAAKHSGGAHNAVLQSVAAVLSGAIFGNTCSAIADNTILACMASGCEITEHVTTMTLYVGIVAAVSMLAGTLPCGMGLYPGWAGLLIGAAALVAIVLVFGRPHDEPPRRPRSHHNIYSYFPSASAPEGTN